MTDRQLKQLVNDLNLGNIQSLAAEWEVSILYALNRSGSVSHEPDLGGQSRVDLHFRDPNSAAEFIADITCVSDRGLDDVNPVDRVMELVRESAARLGINPGGFHLRIGHDRIGSYPNEKVTLRLPPLHAIPAYVETRIVPELIAIASNPSVPRHIALGNNANDIQISYDPAGRFLGTGYAAYRHATVVDSNPLYHRLQDKAEQLRKSGYSGPKGIIVCDGGCETLTSTMHSWDAFSKEKIVKCFFEDDHSISISFVVLLWVVSSPFVPGQQQQHAVSGQFATNPRADVSLPKSLGEILKQLPQHWPAAIQNAENARTELEGPCPPHDPFRSHSFWSGGTMSEHTFRFSARGLLKMLAGRRSHAEFEQAHGFAASEPARRPNPFEQALRKGFTITAVKIDRSTDRDDDWIEIQMDGPDPAVSRFRKPGGPKSS
ncbi:MAG: hypothetical protein ACLQME_23150 [Alphaproteobacteria bacterium]